jgi:hypothetical protein
MAVTSKNIFSGIIALSIGFLGCSKSTKSRSDLIPDNISADKPIIIKENQAIIITPENNTKLMIGASVLSGKLSVSEIDTKGKSLSVTWFDEDSWETSVVSVDGDQTSTIIDKNGDGIPDMRVVVRGGTVSRYELQKPQWIEMK